MSLTIKPNTTVVTLLQGDDLDGIVARADDVTREAKATPQARLGDDPVRDAIVKYDEGMDAAVERAVKVKMTQLPRKEYRALKNEHPPRMVDGPDGPVVHAEDAPWGFNRETFGDVLVPPCVDLDQFDSEAARDAFLDGLSDGWFSKLYSAAVSLNQGAGPDTKARLSSHLAPMFDETSPSPERLG